MRGTASALGLIIVAACKPEQSQPVPAPAYSLAVVSGGDQSATVGNVIRDPVVVRIVDSAGHAVSGKTINWTITGGGATDAPTSVSAADGTVSTSLTVGPTAGTGVLTAATDSAASVTVNVTALAATYIIDLSLNGAEAKTCLGVYKIVSGVVHDPAGNAAPEVQLNWSSSIATDSVVFGGMAITARVVLGSFVGEHIIRATADGAAPATITLTTVVPCPRRLTQVRASPTTASPGSVVALTASVINDSGKTIIGVPGNWAVLNGGGSITMHSGTGGIVGDFTIGATPGVQQIQVTSPGLAPVTISVTALPVAIPLVAVVPMPTGATTDHDAFVRDGLAFVFAWNKGVLIYDVGNGVKGGSPSSPQLVSQLITSDNGVAGGPAVHNGWWFQNPVTGEKRYLFIGQEGPGAVGSTSSGDIHIVDVADLAHPVEVGFIRLPGAGTHNFWMDEAGQILYAAFYNGGVARIDVSGVLAGDMSSRIVKQVLPGGAGKTFTWGVMLANGTLYASDMLSGLWALDPVTLAVKGGGNRPVSEQCGKVSDLWVLNSVAYTGNWGCFGSPRVTMWTLDVDGVPFYSNTISAPGGGTTMGDVGVSPDGKVLVGVTEGGEGNGLYLWSRADPLHPVLVANYLVSQGLHTAEIKVVNGRTYVFAARDPSGPAMLIFDITDVVH